MIASTKSIRRVRRARTKRPNPRQRSHGITRLAELAAVTRRLHKQGPTVGQTRRPITLLRRKSHRNSTGSARATRSKPRARVARVKSVSRVKTRAPRQVRHSRQRTRAHTKAKATCGGSSSRKKGSGNDTRSVGLAKAQSTTSAGPGTSVSARPPLRQQDKQCDDNWTQVQTAIDWYGDLLLSSPRLLASPMDAMWLKQERTNCNKRLKAAMREYKAGAHDGVKYIKLMDALKNRIVRVNQQLADRKLTNTHH